MYTKGFELIKNERGQLILSLCRIGDIEIKQPIPYIYFHDEKSHDRVKEYNLFSDTESDINVVKAILRTEGIDNIDEMYLYPYELYNSDDEIKTVNELYCLAIFHKMIENKPVFYSISIKNVIPDALNQFFHYNEKFDIFVSNVEKEINVEV